jgi:hypothetical protein
MEPDDSRMLADGRTRTVIWLILDSVKRGAFCDMCADGRAVRNLFCQVCDP